MGRRRRRSRATRRARRAFLLLLLAAALGAAAWAYAQQASSPDGGGGAPPARAEGTLRVHVLDVGQGDATVWELPDGTLVVYDCGPPASDAEENPLVRYLRDDLGRPRGSRLHALVASHGHLDHVGGCDEVLAEYDFDHAYELWYDGSDAPASYGRFLDQLRAEGTQVHTLGAVPSLEGEIPFGPGDPIALPESARVDGVAARILWPPSFQGGWDQIAEASLVVRLTHGGASYCFQGDVERAQERALAQREGDLSCDFYLVGHHGSRQASDPAWLARMDPQVAVVSFGANAYGHPTSEALCRVQQAGATVYATHRAGTIVVESDGAGVRVARGEPETKDYCAPGEDYWA